MEEQGQQYPVFFKVVTKSAWVTLNQKADNILGYGNLSANTYSKPIIDQLGKYYFIVNQEVSELVDLSLCVPYESIALKIEEI
jgi:hypothetical protein